MWSKGRTLVGTILLLTFFTPWAALGEDLPGEGAPLGGAKTGAAPPQIAATGRVETTAGQPVVSAQVSLFAAVDRFAAGVLMAGGEVRGGPIASARTDDAGRFRLRAPGPGMWTVVIEQPGRVSWEYPLHLLEETELPTVRLDKLHDLRLRAADEEGSAVTAALGMLSESSRWLRRKPSSGDWWPAAQVARADPEGVLTLARGVGNRFEALLWAPGFLEAAVDVRELRGREVRLRRGVSRTLEVRRPGGGPAADVLVRIGQGRWTAGRTDGAGRLTIAAPRENALPLELVTEDGPSLSVTLLPAGEAGDPASFSLPPNERIAGRVVDARDRRPIASALVYKRTDRAGFVRTDANGAYTLSLDEPVETATLGVEAMGYRRAEVAVTSLHGAAERGGGLELTVALEPAAALEAQVVDASNRPVAGVEIEANVDLERNHLLNNPLPVAARTAENGRFRLPGLIAERTYELILRASGFATMRTTVAGIAPGTTTRETFVLERGLLTEGEVLGPSNEPVANAEVVLYPSRASGRHRFLKEDVHGAVSQADGRFELPQILPGNYDLGISARGFAPVRVPGIEIPEGDGPVDLGTVVLGEEVLVTGRVSDPEGQPLEGVRIFYIPLVYEIGAADDRLSIQRAGRTGPRGEFELGGFHAGQTVDLTFGLRGYQRREITGVEISSGEPLEVVLEPASEISGQVVDGDGKPVEGSRVALVSHASGLISGGGGGHAPERGIAAGPDGRFVLGGLFPGRYSLRASAEGYARSAAVEVEVPPGESPAGLRLVLEPGAVVGGRIFDQEGSPLSGVQVSVVRPAPRFGEARSRARTQSDGSYQLEGLATGATSLEFTHPDHPREVRDLDVRSGFHRFDLTLEAGFEVSGRVIDESRSPVAGVDVALAGGSEARKRALSGADGTFVLSGVSEGRYQLRATKEGYAEARLEAPLEVAGLSVSGLELRMTAGGTVTGHLLGLELDELGAVHLSARSASGGRVEGSVDPSGRYRIDHLSPGEWILTASLGGSEREVSKRVTLEPGASQTWLDLDFASGVTLTGEVSQEGGAVAGAHVVVSGGELTIPRSGRTGHDGRFRLAGLEAGAYRLVVADFTAGLYHEEDVELSSDLDLRIELDPAELAGRVLEAGSGAPIGGARVELGPAAGRGGGLGWKLATTSDAAGHFVLRGVERGDGRLTVSKEGYAVAHADVRPGVSQDELEIALERTAGLDLEVLLASGRPAARVEVAVLDPSGRTLTGGRYPAGEGGRVHIPDTPPGSWQVLVASPGEAVGQLSVRVPGPPARIRLPASGGLSITVPELDGAPSFASVTLARPDGSPYRTPTLGGVSEAWQMSRGSVVFEALPAGPWNVVATAADGRSWDAQAAVRPASVTQLLLE